MKVVFRNRYTTTYTAEIELTDEVCEELAELCLGYLSVTVPTAEITNEIRTSLYTPNFMRDFLIRKEKDIILTSYEKEPISIRDYLLDYLRDWADDISLQEGPEDEHINFAIVW